jgi:hypothetical protein
MMADIEVDTIEDLIMVIEIIADLAIIEVADMDHAGGNKES